MPPLRKLSADGVCGDCSKDSQTEFMTCSRCLIRFHVINCDKNDNQCTQTQMNGWENVRSRYPCFNYTCDDCRENQSLRNDDILVNRLASMEENLLFLVKEIKSLKQNPSSSGNQDIRPSYADKVNKPAVIVIEGKTGEEAETQKINMDKLKKAAIQSSASVLKTYLNGVQDTVLICNDESSKQKLLPHVTKIFSDRKVSTPPSRLPTVTIKDIESNITKEELLDAVQMQNRDSGLTNITVDNFNILFIKEIKSKNPRYPDTFLAVVRVSDQVRTLLKTAGNRLFVKAQSCKVEDRLFVRRCNKCQLYKHWHKECKSDHSVCGKCGDHHDTRSCESPTKKCINCATNGYTDLDHETSWRNCPSYKKEQERLEKTIPYYNSKN